MKIRWEYELSGGRPPTGFDPDGHAWTVTLFDDMQGKSVSFPFFTGSLAGAPTLGGVLESLVVECSSVDATDGFEEWTDEVGYNPDSRKAEATYRKIVALRNKLYRFFPNEAAWGRFLIEPEWSVLIPDDADEWEI